MTDKIKALLKVLDMPKREQWDWLWNNKLIHDGESRADLAFRLRDEAVANDNDDPLWNAKRLVAGCVTKNDVWKVIDGRDVTAWFADLAQPIHWIIAALIAKELAKEQE